MKSCVSVRRQWKYCCSVFSPIQIHGPRRGPQVNNGCVRGWVNPRATECGQKTWKFQGPYRKPESKPPVWWHSTSTNCMARLPWDQLCEEIQVTVRQGLFTHFIAAACNEVTKSSEAYIGIPIPKIRFKCSGMWSFVLGRILSPFRRIIVPSSPKTSRSFETSGNTNSTT